MSLDYSRQDVMVFSVGGDRAGMPSVNPQIKINKPELKSQEPLQAELQSFLDCVRTRSKPLVSAEDGRSALKLALDIVATMAKHGEKVQLETLRR